MELGTKYNDQRQALQLGGTALASLSFQALGIVYADIGTSPLYTLGGIWPASGPVPPKEDVIGGVSAIIWALTILPLIKYVFIALRFGTYEGEGGTFALYHGLFPPEHSNGEDDRALTSDSVIQRPSTRRSSAERLAPFKWILLAWSLFGTSLAFADGILTPAVSVTSAVGGIGVAKPNVLNDTQVISIAFLVAFFLVQRFGVKHLARAFAPTMFIWMLLIGGCGIYNITQYPGVFRAIDPSRAVMFFVRTGDYDYLAGILLALTGCEAMFANLGQFNRLSIQISFSLFVYPMLILAYLGQGARLITNGEVVIQNIFYQSIPGKAGGPLYWIVFVVAILATLIASQALVTACFSLVQQLMNLKSLPPLRMIYTSETVQGQVYFPFANYALMVGTIIMVAVFKNLANMTNAYGFAVSTVMFTTTCLIAIQAYYVKHLPWFVAVGFFLIFGFFDGLFWGASLRKVPRGAWVPLMIGCILVAFMFFWTWAKGLEDRFDGMNRRNLRQFIAVDPSEEVREKKIRKRLNAAQPTSLTYVAGESMKSGEDIKEDDEDLDTSVKTQVSLTHPLYLVPENPQEPRRPLNRVNTCAVFHKLTGGRGVPHTFYGLLSQWPSIPRVVIFLSVRVMNVNRIPLEERYTITKVRSIQGFYGVTYMVGFRDDYNMDVGEIVERICGLESRIGVNDEAATDMNIKEIRAAAQYFTHIVPHYDVMSKSREGNGVFTRTFNWIRAFLLESVYARITVMFPETENWIVQPDKVIRVGINAEI